MSFHASGLSRRPVLKAGVAAGGGLLLSLSVPALGSVQAKDQTAFAPNAFLRLGRDGKITMTIPQVEMGQGIYTSLAMILADELDAAFEHVSVEAAPPNDALYANPILRFQVTGGSTSVRGFWMPFRIAGAGARAMLVEAAARTWGVEPAACRTAESQVIHDLSNRRIDYAALVDAAAG